MDEEEQEKEGEGDTGRRNGDHNMEEEDVWRKRLREGERKRKTNRSKRIKRRKRE